VQQVGFEFYVFNVVACKMYTAKFKSVFFFLFHFLIWICSGANPASKNELKELAKVNCCGLNDWGFVTSSGRNFSLLHHVWIGSGVNPGSYKMSAAASVEV